MYKKHLFLLMTSSLLFTWDAVHAKDDDKESRGGDRKEKKEERREERGSQRQERREDRGGDRRERREERGSQRQERREDRGGDRKERKEPSERESQEPQERSIDTHFPPGFKRDDDRKQPSRDLRIEQERVRDGDRRSSRDFDRDWNKKDLPRVIESDRTRNSIRIDVEKDRGDRRDHFSKDRLREREQRWNTRGKHWRRDFKDYRKRERIFDDYFWNRFRSSHRNWVFDNRFHWGVETTWPSLVVWLPWQMSRPIYYYYGSDGMVYYSATEDFAYLTPVSSREQFVAEAARIANTQRPLPRSQSDWLPLGMFALASDDESSAMPKRYISLAISKQGAVTGAYFDVANNEMLEIQGGIDPQNQRAAWKFVGRDWPIMESGLYNLTKEESTLLIHTSPRRTDTQLIIRLK